MIRRGESESEEAEGEGELELYFLDLLADFFEDLLLRLEDFVSNFFLSLLDEGFEFRSTEEGDLHLFECLVDFFLCLGIRV